MPTVWPISGPATAGLSAALARPDHRWSLVSSTADLRPAVQVRTLSPFPSAPRAPPNPRAFHNGAAAPQSCCDPAMLTAKSGRTSNARKKCLRLCHGGDFERLLAPSGSRPFQVRLCFPAAGRGLGPLAPATRSIGKWRVVAREAPLVGYVCRLLSSGQAAKCAKMPHSCARLQPPAILLTY